MSTTRKALFQKRAPASGTYWTSQAPKASLRHYLRGLRGDLLKSAQDTVRWWQSDSELKKFLSGLSPADYFSKSAGIGVSSRTVRHRR